MPVGSRSNVCTSACLSSSRRTVSPSPPFDPQLELHSGNGTLVASNDDWKSTQQAQIEAAGIPPSNDVATLAPATTTRSCAACRRGQALAWWKFTI